MATTRLIPLHVNKGKSIAKTLFDRTDYAKNPGKTENGELITGYACDPRTVDEEFMLAKREYEYITGRNQGRRDVIAYHIRQSFKPGEISPQEANEIGYELAMRFTKGKHSFIVCTHTDKAHVHNHIVFNSTALDCTRKFKDFSFSAKAIRRISDLLCAERGLSVIEKPKARNGKHYGDWLADEKKPSYSEIIKQKIDELLPDCTTFDDFIAALRAADFIVKDKRKHISVLAPGQKRPSRLNTLGDDYTEAAIRERLSDTKAVRVTEVSAAAHRPSLLIDIQAKIMEGKGAGYVQWAKIFNLKEAAKTLVFLKENGIDSYDDLVQKSSVSSDYFSSLNKKIKDIEARQKEISELQKQIGTYGKTRDIYAKYKASGFDRDFYDIHAADIILHIAAKKFFDDLGMKKLPSINQLKQEWGELASERKALYADYKKHKDLSRELAVAKMNATNILGITSDTQEHNARAHNKPHDR
jgi:hypothetical protein